MIGLMQTRNWRKFQYILMAVVFSVCVGLIICTVEDLLKKCETCAWCRERIVGEGTQWQEWWLHDRCYSDIEMLARYDVAVYKGERSPTVAKRITELIEERLTGGAK